MLQKKGEEERHRERESESEMESKKSEKMLILSIKNESGQMDKFVDMFLASCLPLLCSLHRTTSPALLKSLNYRIKHNLQKIIINFYMSCSSCIPTLISSHSLPLSYPLPLHQ